MRKRTRFALLTLSLFVATSDVACSGALPDRTQSPPQAIRSETRLYRTAPEGELFLHIYYPLDWKADDSRPAIVFFFGGGWKSGSYEQFVPAGGILCESWVGCDVGRLSDQGQASHDTG